MQTTPIEIAFIAGGSTIIGTLLGAWIARRNAIKLQSIAEFNKAAASFRATFVDEIFHIQKDPGPFFERFGINRDEIEIANEKAKIIFEIFLPRGQIASFNAAWEQYKHPDEEHEIKGPPWDPEYIKELAKIRISHVNAILEFARPKL